MASPLHELTLSGYLDNLGSKTPAPGGGAAAATTAATAAALASMVVAYSVTKKSLEEHKPTLERASAWLERARALALQLADEDAEAFTGLGEAKALSESDPTRAEKLAEAKSACINVPRTLLAACGDLLRQLDALVPITNTYLRSDLAIAAVLAECAASSSTWNIRINLELLETDAQRIELEREIAEATAQNFARRAHIEDACR